MLIRTCTLNRSNTVTIYPFQILFTIIEFVGRHSNSV